MDNNKLTWSELKEVCTSLDNIFYGAMVYAIIGILVWLWMLMSVYVIIIPVGYVLLCYIGQYVKTHIKHGKRSQENAADNAKGLFI